MKIIDKILTTIKLKTLSSLLFFMLIKGLFGVSAGANNKNDIKDIAIITILMVSSKTIDLERNVTIPYNGTVVIQQYILLLAWIPKENILMTPYIKINNKVSWTVFRSIDNNNTAVDLVTNE